MIDVLTKNISDNTTDNSNYIRSDFEYNLNNLVKMSQTVDETNLEVNYTYDNRGNIFSKQTEV